VLIKFSRPTNITAAHLSQTTFIHLSKFHTIYSNVEVEMAFNYWFDYLGQNCKVVLRWTKCIHVTGDVIGMSGLRVAGSGL